MFGYFLRRVDKRFQLEKALGLLPVGQGGGGDAAWSACSPKCVTPCHAKNKAMPEILILVVSLSSFQTKTEAQYEGVKVLRSFC